MAESPKLLDWLRPRTLRAKFLSVNVPLVMLSTLTLFALFEITTYRSEVRRLHDRLEQLASGQSAILVAPLWTFDQEQIHLIVAALENEPDLAGVVVSDESGRVLSSTGTLDGVADDLVSRREIVFGGGAAERVIGRLTVAFSDRRLRAELRARALFNGALLGGLLLAVIVSALVANRRSIGLPLERLLASIRGYRSGGERMPVDWHSGDEMGRIATAFNEMQDRQQRYESELQDASPLLSPAA